MTDLVVIVPTRGRPHAARELAQTFKQTCTGDTELVFAVDDNDPTREQYEAVGAVMALPSRTMNQALNMAAAHVAKQDDVLAIGFMGDDHRPRTVAWDQAYIDVLREFGTGIVYGNDLLQGEKLPTQVAMTANIVRTLGFYAPPDQKHLYLDNFWLDLGRAAGCLCYLPDVIVEHVHPFAHKAEMDEGYVRVNAPEMYDHDRVAYEKYRRERFADDVAKVRAL